MVLTSLRNRLVLGVLVLGVAACATACGHWETVPVKTPTATVGEGWMGHPRSEVEKVWGKPSRVLDDGQGGSILEFDQDKGFKVEVEPNRASPSPVDDLHDQGDRRVTVQQAGNVAARFWLDREGSVYQTWFSAGMWKKGIPSPPPSSD